VPQVRLRQLGIDLITAPLQSDRIGSKFSGGGF
jgi:hypothetical protein